MLNWSAERLSMSRFIYCNNRRLLTNRKEKGKKICVTTEEKQKTAYKKFNKINQCLGHSLDQISDCTRNEIIYRQRGSM